MVQHANGDLHSSNTLRCLSLSFVHTASIYATPRSKSGIVLVYRQTCFRLLQRQGAQLKTQDLLLKSRCCSSSLVIWDEWRYKTALIKRNMTCNCVPVATTSHHRTWNSYHLGISLSQCSPLNARTNNRMCVRSIFSCSILLYAYYPQVTAYQSAAECLITQPKTLLAPRYVPLSISHLNIFRTQY